MAEGLQALCTTLILATCLAHAEPAINAKSAIHSATTAPISAPSPALSTEDVSNLVNRDIPELRAHVIDLTQTLSQAEQSQLDAKLMAFELEKGSQIAVLIVPTTQPEDIAQYANRVARSWKLGRKLQQDGVLLLVVKNERKLRIEVDSGLQGAIPDVYAKRIVSDIIAPKFKTNDYYGGIDAGVNQLISLVKGENLAAPSQKDSLNLNLHIVDYWVFYLIAMVFLSEFFTKILGRFFGSTATAGVMGGATGFLSIWPVGIFTGFVAFFVALLFSAPKTYSSGVKRAGSNRRDGSDSAINFILELLMSNRSGRGGGGWSDGGGWSGGGGSSGWSGGGASGDW
ncbi:MAG: YgcG family protein [Methylotenera sp.]|nr:YgcG family protein [Methylotenera sp.]